MLTVEQLIGRLKDLPPDTAVCIAEQDEAFASDVAEIEVVSDARMRSADADASEAVQLSDGKDTVVVLRW